MSELSVRWHDLWQRLSDGVDDPAAPARLITLATARLDGGAAARMVVLRGVDQEAHTLTIYTHAQSQKVTELTHDPSGEILLWDAHARFQTRLRVTLNAAHGSKDLWDAQSRGARMNYAASLIPGAQLDAPTVPEEASPDAFTVILAKVQSADILDLSGLPHRRAAYTGEDGFAGQWIAP